MSYDHKDSRKCLDLDELKEMKNTTLKNNKEVEDLNNTISQSITDDLPTRKIQAPDSFTSEFKQICNEHVN